MISFVLMIGIIVLAIGIAHESENAIYIGLTIALISGIILICISIDYPFHIDEKIELYETENKVIEDKIKETVRVYMEYEQETYKSLLENADLTTILVAYPDLNSNELVKSEIETYKENNNKLKELKERKIGKSTLDWWIYFGK